MAEVEVFWASCKAVRSVVRVESWVWRRARARWVLRRSVRREAVDSGSEGGDLGWVRLEGVVEERSWGWVGVGVGAVVAWAAADAVRSANLVTVIC